MNDNLIREWLETLNDPKLSRLEIVEDLLDHANEDGMGPEDRATCVRAKELLS